MASTSTQTGDVYYLGGELYLQIVVFMEKPYVQLREFVTPSCGLQASRRGVSYTPQEWSLFCKEHDYFNQFVSNERSVQDFTRSWDFGSRLKLIITQAGAIYLSKYLLEKDGKKFIMLNYKQFRALLGFANSISNGLEEKLKELTPPPITSSTDELWIS